MNRVQVIIPVREGGDPSITIASLARSSFAPHVHDIMIMPDRWANANRCRNEGLIAAERMDTFSDRPMRSPKDFVVFSDDDIIWSKTGIARLVAALDAHPEAAYSFGAYEMGGRIYCDHQFDPQALRKRNLASTMSLIRRPLFPGFDPAIKRLQDWDLWLTMAARGHYGVHCGGAPIFSTAVRQGGITYGGSISYEEAFEVLRKKHSL